MIDWIISGIELHKRLGIEQYELIAKELQWHGPREMEKALEKNVTMRDATIVDIGCGTGQLSEIFSWHAARDIIAVDGVADYVIHAIKTGRANSGHHLNIATDKLLIRDETADLVTASGLFTYIADPTHAINEMVRITKTGGHIAVNFHPSQNPLQTSVERIGAESLGSGSRKPVYNMYHHAAAEILGLFDSLGTRPVHQNTVTDGVLRYGPTQQWVPLTTCIFQKIRQPSSTL